MSQPIQAFKNALKIPELKQRIIFSLALLAVYRLGSFVPTPGINGAEMTKLMGNSGGLFGLYNMFSGGAFSRATIFALGIMPYISASIIMSLLTPVIPSLQRLQKEGGSEGQRKINDYTRYGTILLCIVQSTAIALWLTNLNDQNPGLIPRPGFGFICMCVLTLTTGTAFIMWLGEQISERGVGNGISLIIFTNIIAGMPVALITMFRMIANEQMKAFQLVVLVALMIVVVGGVVLMTTAQRRIPVQYPRQVKGRKVYGGQRNYLPLRVNQAGVIPIIFASSILSIPMMLGKMFPADSLAAKVLSDWLSRGGIVYNIVFGIAIVGFTFFYVSLTFNPVEMADNLKKYGGVVIGVRPGKATADYLSKVMVRITLVGALFLVVVALMPSGVSSVLGIQNYRVSRFFGGTSLLILVGVGLDLVRQIEQHLVMHHYDGFMRGGKRIRGRRGR